MAMTKLLLAAATLALAGCARTEPIPEDALDDVAAPAPVAIDEEGEAPALQPTPGMRWETDASANAALYGSDRGSPALSVACREDDGKALVLTRFFPTVPAGAGTMTLTGNGAIASVPVSAEANQGRPGGRLSATLDLGDLANNVAAVLRGPDPVNVSVTGAEPLVLVGGSEVEGVLEACLGAGDAASAAEPDAAETPSADAPEA